MEILTISKLKSKLSDEEDKLYDIQIRDIEAELFDAKINHRQAKVSLRQKRNMLDYHGHSDEDTDPECECEDNYELEYYYSQGYESDCYDEEKESHICSICNKTGHFENRCFRMHKKNKNFCSRCAKSKKILCIIQNNALELNVLNVNRLDILKLIVQNNFKNYIIKHILYNIFYIIANLKFQHKVDVLW